MSLKYSKKELGMSVIVVILILLFTTVSLYSAPTTSGSIKLIASTIPEAKVESYI